MPEPNRSSREKIGTANLSNLGVVDIYYAGGSTFEFGIRNDNGKYLRITKTKLESLVQQGLVVITAPKRYADITRSISSDGSTKDQNADGTPKSAVDRTMDMLSEERIISQRVDGKYEVVDFDTDEGRRPASKKQVSLFGDDDEEKEEPESQIPVERPSAPQRTSDPFEDDDDEDYDLPQVRTRRSTAFEDKHRSELRRQALEGQGRADQAALEALDSTRKAAPIEDGRPAKKRKKGASGIHGDLNGDGVVDKFDEIEEERKSKSILLLGLLLLASVAAVVLSIAMHTLTTSILDATGISVSHDGQMIEGIANIAAENGEEAAPASEANTESDTAGQDENQQAAQAEQASNAYYDLGERAYDPETTVRGFELADVAVQKTAAQFIDHLHSLYQTGKVKEALSIVDLDTISTTLGQAYGNYAKEVHNLNEQDRDRYAADWGNQFNKLERSFIVDHNPARSIFGGKIREVRRDGGNENVFYIIMEAVDGDHQRVGLVFTRKEDGYYYISNILSPDGYIRMISDGALP